MKKFCKKFENVPVFQGLIKKNNCGNKNNLGINIYVKSRDFF